MSTTPTQADNPQTVSEEDDEAPEFANKRMENAYYWAAQAREFVKANATIDDMFYVEVIGGKPVIVFDVDIPNGAIDALAGVWITEGFPTESGVLGETPQWTRRELEGETRLFVEPSDERLKMSYVPLTEIEKDRLSHGHDEKPF